MFRIVFVVIAVLLALQLLPSFQRLDEGRRRRVTRGALLAIAAVVVVVVLARFGLEWLGLAGAAALAVLRTLAPLFMRLLPLAASQHRTRQAREQGTNVGGRPTPKGGMSREEALDILGAKEGASREEILASYRNLMRKVHPDSPGGSTYLASKLNQAKDVLLN